MKEENKKLLEEIKKLQEEILQKEKENKVLKSRKEYGLVWKDKPEIFDEQTKNALPILKEKGGSFKDVITDKDSDYNILIEGDNYHSLSVLNYTHKNKIDVIYIDPPYNTGSTINKDFYYNDKFIEKEDSFRHSKWLSFMSKRLKLAKNLLKDDGVIFISIDDNEQAHLKLLCDEIFGENNFINQVVNQSAKSVFGSKASAKEKTIIKTKDYVLVYKKQKVKIKPLYIKSQNPIFTSHEFMYENEEKVNTKDWFEKEYKDYFKNKWEILGFKKEEDFNFRRVGKKDIVKFLKEDELFYKEVFDRLLDVQYSTTIYSKEIVDKNIIAKLKTGKVVKYDNVLLIRENCGNGKLRFLRSLRESCNYVNDEFCKVDILGDVWDTSAGYGNINVEGNISFKNGKKPIILLKNILNLSENKNLTVLDFFAGSGTTGHAVLDLNKQDGGNRKFILCTNNENKICEDITWKRIKKVSQGYTNSKGKKVEGLGGNIKYLKTDFVKKELDNSTTDEDKLKLTYKAGTLLALKENTFDEKEKNNFYQVFESGRKIIGIYFRENKEKIEELLKTLKKSNKKATLYIFSWASGEFHNDFEEYKDIKIENIPEPILEIYKKINN